MKNVEGEYFCTRCNGFVRTRVVKKKECYPVKDMTIEIDANVVVCAECRKEIFDKEIDGNNLFLAYSLYREKKGLLKPEEIKSIREQYGLSQVAFAKVLGLGEKTIARYENGSLQDEAQNNLILLMKNRENFETLLVKNRGKLNETEYLTAIANMESLNLPVVSISSRVFPSLDMYRKIKQGGGRFTATWEDVDDLVAEAL